MKFLFKLNQEVLLISFAVVLLAILVGYFIWGVGNVFDNVSRATNVKNPSKTEVSGFDIDGASKLDFRGLLQ